MPSAYKSVLFALTMLFRSGAFIQEASFKVIGQMSGADSLVEASKVTLVKTNQSWTDTWQLHRQSGAIVPPGAPAIANTGDKPQVDFTKNVVLCLFGGQSRNVCGFELAQTAEVKGTIVLRIRPLTLPNSGTLVVQNPYMMLVLPRTKKKMQVQLDQSILGGEGWRVLGDFGPTAREN